MKHVKDFFRFLGGAIGAAGRATVALIGIAGITIALANNYTMTQGTGTTFASVVISSVNYAAQLICDKTVGTTQCASVDANGNLRVDTATSGNLINAINAPAPCQAQATWNAASGLTGTQAVRCDGSASLWSDIGAWAGTLLGTPTTYGTAPTGNAPGVNAYVTNATPDPCTTQGKVNYPVSVGTSGLTQIVPASGSTSVYVCSMFLLAQSANNVGMSYGTGSNCGTGTGAVVGSTNAASSLSLLAGGGFTLGNGLGTVAFTPPSQAFCLNLGSAVVVAGNITAVNK